MLAKQFELRAHREMLASIPGMKKERKKEREGGEKREREKIVRFLLWVILPRRTFFHLPEYNCGSYYSADAQ